MSLPPPTNNEVEWQEEASTEKSSDVSSELADKVEPSADNPIVESRTPSSPSINQQRDSGKIKCFVWTVRYLLSPCLLNICLL